MPAQQDAELRGSRHAFEQGVEAEQRGMYTAPEQLSPEDQQAWRDGVQAACFHQFARQCEHLRDQPLC